MPNSHISCIDIGCDFLRATCDINVGLHSHRMVDLFKLKWLESVSSFKYWLKSVILLSQGLKGFWLHTTCKHPENWGCTHSLTVVNSWQNSAKQSKRKACFHTSPSASIPLHYICQEIYYMAKKFAVWLEVYYWLEMSAVRGRGSSACPFGFRSAERYPEKVLQRSSFRCVVRVCVCVLYSVVCVSVKLAFLTFSSKMTFT